MTEFTKEQQAAMDALARAFKKCVDSGLHGCVMDGNLIVCNTETYNEAREIEHKYRSNGAYPTVAYAQETSLKVYCTVKDHGLIEDCGGY